jgi:hypothetical protein
MWNRLRNFFYSKSQVDETKAENAHADTFDMSKFDELKAQVNEILKLNLSNEETRQKYGEQVFRTVQQLSTEIEKVRQSANGYPANPTSASIWFLGLGYSNLACALTEHFKIAGWLKREENASALWAKATLAVNSHYHHLVGTAMLANADCQERLGNVEHATNIYISVVKDFVFLVDDWVSETVAPVDEERIALSSLNTAVTRLLSLGEKDMETIDYTEMIDLNNVHSKLESILSRPTSS